MDVEVVISKSWNSTLICNFICLICLVRLNSRVMDTSLMLSHQNVILFSLLVNLNLLVQILDVVLLNLLTFLISDTLLVRNVIYSLLNLIGIEGIVVPLHLPLVLLFFHLEM